MSDSLMNPHRIRLRGPWQFRPADSDENFPPAGRVTLPAAWQDLLGAGAGCVEFSRRFHCPSNLEPESRVNLVFEGLTGDGKIHLNDVDLGSFSQQVTDAAELRIPIQQHLKPMNDLIVEVRFDPGANSHHGGLWGMVVLEIFEPG